MSSTSSQKRPREPEPEDGGLGGLYDFLPPPDPERDAAAQAAAKKKARPKLPPEDKSRVIFLDIDGVLLPTGSVQTILIDGVALPVREKMSESDFSAAALGNLRSIVMQTGASIVLSSEWRRTEAMKNSIGVIFRSKELPQLRDFTVIFKPKSDIPDPVIAWCERRAREIGQWLKMHPEVTSWVAIDDLDFNWADAFRAAGTPVMKCRSVHTDCQHCITEDDANEAVRILLNPPNPTEEEIQVQVEASVRATQKALKDGAIQSTGVGRSSEKKDKE
mmetsp:Transcript_28639/g.66011  ORF Transcript_28639/g.66011 Transcript_28639/m.66011 type:complete len:276 (-) Transcript_28639:43-870(-)